MPMLHRELGLSSKLPYMRISHKAHKPQPAKKWRYIASAKDCCMTPYSKVAEAIGADIIAAQRARAEELQQFCKSFYGCSTMLYTPVKSVTDVFLNLPQRITADFTCDIQTYFEAIPLDQQNPHNLHSVLAAELRSMCSEAHGSFAKACVVIKWDRTRAAVAGTTWYNQAPGKAQAPEGLLRTCGHGQRYYMITLTMADVLSLYEMVCSQVAFLSLGRLWQPRLGLPMGFEASVTSVTWYASHFELAVAKRIMRHTQGGERVNLLEQFRLYFRAMDDIRVINGPQLQQMLMQPDYSNPVGWVYPSELQLEDTTHRDSQGRVTGTTYLDMYTRVQPDGSYTVSWYDKTQKLPFTPIMFASPWSNRPAGNVHKVVLTMAFMIMYRSSSSAKAIRALCQVLRTLKKRGYDMPRVAGILDQFLGSAELPGLPYKKRVVQRSPALRAFRS